MEIKPLEDALAKADKLVENTLASQLTVIKESHGASGDSFVKAVRASRARLAKLSDNLKNDKNDLAENSKNLKAYVRLIDNKGREMENKITLLTGSESIEHLHSRIKLNESERKYRDLTEEFKGNAHDAITIQIGRFADAANDLISRSLL